MIKPEDLKLCNCAGCGDELLGSSHQEAWTKLTPAQKKDVPKPVAGRVDDRPYCASCLGKPHMHRAVTDPLPLGVRKSRF